MSDQFIICNTIISGNPDFPKGGTYQRVERRELERILEDELSDDEIKELLTGLDEMKPGDVKAVAPSDLGATAIAVPPIRKSAIERAIRDAWWCDEDDNCEADTLFE